MKTNSMQFEKGYLFHIYNQGNNRQTVFFSRKNYLFFLHKIKTYILPYSDILAWCLMPNHFHLLVLVNEISLGVTSSHTETREKLSASSSNVKTRTLNDSIGIMLRSYTRAINKERSRSGKLFRELTKAECINCPNGITPNFYNTNEGTLINVNNPEFEYPEVCFHYIHQNPVRAQLVKTPTDWEFSSARDYAGLRNGKLINKSLTLKYIIHPNE